jgi:4-amino-4-deoxy-L-arabinose transferase-like glycosyltransferase
MRQDLRHQAWIVFTAAVVMFTNLGVTRLWDQDEAFFARTAVEMHQRHEWIVPYFNGELFAHKPPLMFWLMRVGFSLFSVTEFAARFWSAAFAVGTALLVYRMGRRMFSPQVGLYAGLMISTALMFDVVGRAATPDSFLVFF